MRAPSRGPRTASATVAWMRAAWLRCACTKEPKVARWREVPIRSGALATPASRTASPPSPCGEPGLPRGPADGLGRRRVRDAGTRGCDRIARDGFERVVAGRGAAPASALDVQRARVQELDERASATTRRVIARNRVLRDRRRLLGWGRQWAHQGGHALATSRLARQGPAGEALRAAPERPGCPGRNPGATQNVFSRTT